MTQTEFQELLVKTVQACGEELIERAEDLVGDGELLVSNFDISIHFPVDGYRFDGCPTIEVTREHCSKKAVDVIMQSFN